MSKQATWNGEQRSKQFYALRKGWDWKLTEKTRDPVAAVKAAWGDDIDIVTLMALSPGPADRGWWRYDEGLEIADLGRNARLAKSTLKSLQGEALSEASLRRHASEDRVHDVLNKIRGKAESSAAIFAKQVERSGFLAFLESGDSENKLEMLFNANALHDIIEEEEEEDAEAETTEEEVDSADALHRQLSELRVELFTNLLATNRHANWLGARLLAEIRDHSTKILCDEIYGWLDDLNQVIEARRELVARKQLRLNQQKSELALDWIKENGVSADT